MKWIFTLLFISYWWSIQAQPEPVSSQELDRKPVWGNVVANGIDEPIDHELRPVAFTTLKATVLSNHQVELTWATATEINNDYFEIQYAPSGVFWETIAVIQGQGFSDEPHYYRYVDIDLPQGNHHYRLKQVNFDGSYSYSVQVSALVADDNLPVTILPNPVGENEMIKIQNGQWVEHIEVYNRYGVLVAQTHDPNEQIFMNFGSGVFVVRTKTGKGWTTHQVLVK